MCILSEDNVRSARDKDILRTKDDSLEVVHLLMNKIGLCPLR